VAIFALSAIGAWVWPTLIYIGAILAVFPRRSETTKADPQAPLRLNVLGAGLLTLYAGLAVCYAIGSLGGPMFGFLEPIKAVVRLSVLIVLLYVFYGCRSLLDSDALFNPRRWMSWPQLATLVAFAGMVVLIKGAQGALSDRPGYMAFSVYVLVIGVGAVAKPAVFAVAHIVYFGPWLVPLAAMWPRVCRLIHEHGFGLTLAVLAGFLHSLDSESRHVIYLVPMLVPFFVKATESLEWNRTPYVLMAVIGAFASEVWLNMKGAFVDNAFLYPDQLYWMHHGPFMGNDMYLVQLAGAMVLATVLYVACFRSQGQALAGQHDSDVRQTGLPTAHGHWHTRKQGDSTFRSAIS
jgi:hypothetical protein